MQGVIEIKSIIQRRESLPEFTFECQKSQLLECLEQQSKVGYKNLNLFMLKLTTKDYRFRRENSFTEEMKNKLLFSLAMQDKIQLRTNNGKSQIKLYSKSVCKVLKLQLARYKADNLWNM
jgi:hypothetical protein